MAHETVQLARYAAELRYEHLPAAVVAKAKDVIADTVAACICGADMPWSRIVIDYAERTGPGGTSKILGRGTSVQAPSAALANGALAHAFFAFVLICAIIVHIYAGIWVKGSIRAMTRGWVTPGWAWKHHRAWFREVTKGSQQR